MDLVQDFVVGAADEPPVPRPVSDGVTLIQAGVAKVLHTDLDTHHSPTALEMIDSLERVARQVDAAKVDLLAAIDRTGVHAIDGHRSAKPMVANAAKLSGPEALARQRMARVLDALPQVAAAYYAGDVSSCMVKKLGNTYSNPRVRDLMVDADGWFAGHALDDTYEFFALVVSQWEELADEDGAEQRDARHQRRRDHRLYQDADTGEWHWEGSAAAYDGALISDVFEAFEKIEFDIDWQWVLDTYGPDEANPSLMPRTAAQRRADAFAKVHEYAAKGFEAETGHSITTDIQIDDETFERETLKLAGEDADEIMGPNDPTRDDYISATMTGHRLHARSAVARALLGYLRRNVIAVRSAVMM